MQTKTLLVSLLTASTLLAAAAIHRSQGQRPAPATTGEPALEPLALVEARPFVLDDAFTHNWRSERPQFRGGYLLVLRADASFLRPRQVAEPVLYVGTETAQRLNNPEESGFLVCLVPAPVNAKLQVSLDPFNVPIWFGAAALPEQVDAAMASEEMQRALALGVGPLGKQQLAKQAGTSTTYMRDRGELDLVVADLVEAYSPTELDLISTLRMPLTR